MLHLATGLPPYSKMNYMNELYDEIIKGLNPLEFIEKHNPN